MSINSKLSAVTLLVAALSFSPLAFAQAGAVVDGAASAAAGATTDVGSGLSSDVESALSANADLSTFTSTSSFETVRTSTSLTADADIAEFANTRSNNADAIAALQASISANAELSAALTAQGIDIKDVVAIQVGANGNIRVIVDDRDSTSVAARSTIQTQVCDDSTPKMIMDSSAQVDMQMIGGATQASFVQLDGCDLADFTGMDELRGSINGNANLQGGLKAGGFTQSNVVGASTSGGKVSVYVIGSTKG